MGRTRLAGWILALACALAATDARGEGRWIEVKSPHFRVLTDAGEKEGRQVALGFEQLRKLFQAMDDMRVDPPAPIVIVAARDEGSMKQLLPSFWERRGGVRPAGVFLEGTEKHHIALRLDLDPEYRDDVVYHEYVHLIVGLNFTALPLWLNEGLAEFYAGTTVRDDSVLFGLIAGPHVALLRQQAPLPLADLFAIDGGSREYNEESRVSVLYAQSAVLTHYFMVGDGGVHRKRLSQYIRLLQQGTPEPEAQAQAFGDLKALQKSFFSYLRRYQYSALKAPLDVSGAAATARLLSEAEVLAMRGEFLVRYGRAEDARPLLTRARQADPALAAAAQALGLLEWEAGHAIDARRQLADAIKLAPDDFVSHFLWAQAMPPDAPDLTATEAAARRAIQLNPSFAPAHALLSSVLRRQGKLEPAFFALREACQLEPTHGAYWVQRADLVREMKHPDVADKIETELARTSTSDPEQLYALAAYYRAQKRLDDLERLLRKAADLSPRSALAPLMLGAYLREAGRADDAEAAFRRALAAQPDNPSILNELAWVNADRNVKLPEAMELIDRALKTLPDDAAMLDTKGWTLFRMGRLPEAEKILRRALAGRDDPDIAEHLGDVLAARGQKAEAQQLWKRALDHPDAADARKEELRKKLGG